MRGREGRITFTSLLALVILLLLPLIMRAEEPHSGRVLNYSLKDGLSLGVVNSILQDNQGQMWFATSDGLNRFNGTSFQVFRHSSAQTNTIAGNYIKSIFKDRHGTLWISSRDGLNEFIETEGQFRRYHPQPEAGEKSSDISDISQTKDGNLWLSLNGSGFASFHVNDHRFTYYTQKTLAGLSTNAILNVFEDSKGLLWLGTREGGIDLYQIDAQRRLKKAYLDYSQVPKARVHRIFEDHQQNIWIATAKGLVLFKRNESRFYKLNLPTDSGSEIFLSFVETRQHQLLIGVQEGGLYRIDLSQPRRPEALRLERVKASNQSPITGRSVQSLFIDRDENVWVGTYGDGVYLIGHEPEKFALHTQRTSPAKGENFMRFYGMCQDKEGKLWLGTDGGGIFKSNPNGEIIKHYVPGNQAGDLKDGAVIAAHRDRENNLWFGTYSKGLFRYHPQSDSFQQYAHQADNPGSLEKNDVRVIYQDRQKQLWVGTNGGGLSLLNQKTGQFQHFKPSNSSINANDVRAIVEDAKGNLWIGTYGGGLNYLDVQTKQFKAFFNQSTDSYFISNRIVISLALDASGRLWIGTEGDGLLVYDVVNQKMDWFNDTNGLPSNVINSIQIDAAQVAWVSTNKGLSSVRLKDRRIQNFDQQNNLQRGQFNPGSSLYDAQKDLMFFGGTEGWNSFQPGRIKPSGYHPKAMITGLQVFDKQGGKGSTPMEEYAGKQSIVLDPSQAVFTIQFSSLNYAYPENTRFAYQLEGLDKDWYYTDQERSVTYRYLPAGNYVFKVKVANQDGVWFEDYVSLPIQILPPWYQSWWAYAGYALGLVLVLYGYQRYRLKQTRLTYEVQLAQLEARKEKELHEKRLSFFTYISHECRTPLTLIINPVKELLANRPEGKEQSHLTLIYRNARRLLSMMDQLLLFQKVELETDQLKLSSVNLYEMGNEVFQCFLHQAEMHQITYTYTCENENLEISCDREKLEIALFNLISNALKFTPAGGSVQVVIREKEKQVILSVEDSGIGIDQQSAADIFQLFQQQKTENRASKAGFGIGLYLTKNYVEKHGGTITYQSEKGKGTSFFITLRKKEVAPLSPVSQNQPSVFLEELSGAENLEWLPAPLIPAKGMISELAQEKDTLVLVDDEEDIRTYLRQLLEDQYRIIECGSGEEALAEAHQYQPDLIISDVMMAGMSGLELCHQLKSEASLSHIPLILLTASSRQEIELQSMEERADAFLRKPFEPSLLLAQIASILKNRKDLRSFFYNEITLQSSSFKVSPEYKEFLQDCIQIVERHVMDSGFNTKVLSAEIGLSQSTLYNRIKSISGKSINEFIRFIRLRKAAQLLLSTDITIAEAAYQVGMNDAKYFREQFHKLFGMNPSEYVKKYRKAFHENQTLGQQFFKG
ncbi:two-component regulator propeller domain-containing protein [Siphonobacter sp. SORGH_AS_1065]|uniref:two-component regulator propeller domain-containing protein n=1 Tax=Siphonobacter sp. SORGH_AS_1065 TaxID=3041795 RepID=UPI002783EA0C|nr:two-component regulator propeller domain-containing protein [Siphonobacter sp. SORGH_AS_1065]MDQ1090366.1 ligand-binding sensor domain-containing protein/signal transduction histidine kinase/DNA-binding NarL/FixJ family response regulator [Siphonobacter sp. SORGH_AS_1065]